MANVKSRGLSTLKIKHAGPGVHTDGAGLALRIHESSARNWILRLTIDGKRKVYGLGGFPDVGLAEARTLALEYRKRARQGLDPRPTLVSAPPAIPTLAELTDKVIELRAPTWTGERVEHEWRASLGRHVLPALGKAPVDTITPAHVLDVLTAIWTTTPSMAGRVRQRLASVFDYAIAAGYRTDNPATHVKAALPKRPRGANPRAALPYPEMPDCLATIRARARGSDVSRLALEFIIFTATRSAEARGAMWDEIDLDAKIWTIPPARMKMRRPHRVPLSEGALDVLSRAQPLGRGSAYVFAMGRRRDHAVSSSAVLRTLGLVGYPHATTHGFRASFRTWALEQTDVPFAVAEAALAHNLGGGEVLPYIRADQLERRRELMQGWSDFATRGVQDC